MAYVDQAIAVLEGLAGKSLDNVKMIAIVKNYIIYNEDTGLTNEQIARTFIDSLLFKVRHEVMLGSRQIALNANDATVQAATDASIADL